MPLLPWQATCLDASPPSTSLWDLPIRLRTCTPTARPQGAAYRRLPGAVALPDLPASELASRCSVSARERRWSVLGQGKARVLGCEDLHCPADREGHGGVGVTEVDVGENRLPAQAGDVRDERP